MLCPGTMARVWKKLSIAGAFAVAGLLATASQAAPIVYGNFAGTGVVFQGITEDSATDPTPLYGLPHVVGGDQLDFDPSAFASSASGGAADVTDGLLKGAIQAQPGYGITRFALSELGSYTLAGLGTTATSAAVGQVAFIKITELNGVALGGDSFTVALTSSFSPSGGDFYLPAEAGIAIPWSGSGSVDIAAALASKKASNPGVYGSYTQVTRVEFSTNNTLVTTSEAGTIAFIDKKDLVLDIDAAVPEPASLGLLALAIPALLARRR